MDWADYKVAEHEKAIGKGRRAESETTPVVDGALHKFVGMIYPYNMKEVFEEGFRKVR